MYRPNSKLRRPVCTRTAALALVCFARGALITLLMVASVFALSARAEASDTNYRLAGIIGDGSDRSIAVIEFPDGRQRLVRTGDALGDGKVVEITRIGVRIQLPGEDLILRMRGNPRLAAAGPGDEAGPVGAVSENSGEDTGDENAEEDTQGEGGVRNQQIATSDAARMLESAQRAGQRMGDQPASAESLGRQLNALLEIPEEATVTEVDGVRVDTPQAAIAAIQSSLQQSSGARLTLTGAGELTTVVLAADSEQ